MDVETKAILKQCAKSRSAIAELKGVAATIPYVSILINSSLPGKCLSWQVLLISVE